jgi:hypothetical protein
MGPFILIFCSFSLAAVAGARTIGGRLGLELEGLGESQNSTALFSTPTESGDPLHLTEEPILSREAVPQGILDFTAEMGTSRSAWVRFSDAARIASGRSRNSLDTEIGIRHSAEKFRLAGRWDVRNGRDEPAAGASGEATASWDHDRLPLGMRSQIRLDGEWSRTSNRSYAEIFDYRSFRGQLQIRADLTPRIELRSLGAYRHKDAYHSRIGSFSESAGEFEISGEARDRDHFELSTRIENRSYLQEPSGIPSSLLSETNARYQLRASRVFGPYLEQTLETQRYGEQSGIFQDHWRWTGEAGTDVYQNRSSVPSDTSQEVLRIMDDGTWRVRIGAHGETFHANSTDADSLVFLPSFDSLGGVLGIAREATDALWCDLKLEAGRRHYREHVGSQHLVFEGLDFSLASSDYTYLSASAIAQWTPVAWIRVEAFLQWDDEIHDDRQDDFRLWIANLSLTYPF